MVLVWLLFTLMLFVLESVFVHRWRLARGSVAPDSTLRSSNSCTAPCWR
jgi:hypothetical protein